MFENEQDIVECLRAENAEFEALLRQHASLKDKVRKAELRMISLDDIALTAMKREKLQCKDRMAQIISDYKHAHEIA